MVGWMDDIYEAFEGACEWLHVWRGSRSDLILSAFLQRLRPLLHPFKMQSQRPDCCEPMEIPCVLELMFMSYLLTILTFS